MSGVIPRIYPTFGLVDSQSGYILGFRHGSILLLHQATPDGGASPDPNSCSVTVVVCDTNGTEVSSRVS